MKVKNDTKSMVIELVETDGKYYLYKKTWNMDLGPVTLFELFLGQYNNGVSVGYVSHPENLQVAIDVVEAELRELAKEFC
jgi:hypothetical protein